MPSESPALAGARQIVLRCLDLKPGQQLVILIDETTVDVGVALAEAAEAAGVSQTVILVPVAAQRQVHRERDLSFTAERVLREARALLICVNAQPECLPFRQRILEAHWTAHTKVGHMPGAGLEVLALAAVDLDQLATRCRCLEVALGQGQEIELITYSAGGTAHRLQAGLGGWQRLAVASDGIISDGAWGNVPSGETYIAAMEGTAEGSLVVDGSIPGLVIGPGQEIVLSFERGRLVSVAPAGSPTARWLHETQITKAQARGDLEWANLAEIGIGLNPAVNGNGAHPAGLALSGNMLLDTKAAGTAHIALGNNALMGGHTESSIHCDVVTRAPTIRIDGRIVVERGRLAYVESEWHPHYSQVSLEDSPLQATTVVARSGVQAGRFADGRLQRLLRPEPGRVSACFVGNPETARLAYTLYSALPATGEGVPVAELARRVDMERNVARRVLHILWQYDLIKAG